MDNLPPIRSGRRWCVAGVVFSVASLLPAALTLASAPAQARTPLDFSLDREYRGRVAPSFSHMAPAPDPKHPPPRPGHGTAEVNRQGLTLMKLRFAL